LTIITIYFFLDWVCWDRERVESCIWIPRHVAEPGTKQSNI